MFLYWNMSNLARYIIYQSRGGRIPNLKVRVPEYCTLEEAVDWVHGDDRLTTIIVGKGEHVINGGEFGDSFRHEYCG